jgi:hypothetical protein
MVSRLNKSFATLSKVKRTLRPDSNQPMSACSATKLTLAPAEPAIGNMLDPTVWLLLPDRIMKPVGVELFGLG